MKEDLKSGSIFVFVFILTVCRVALDIRVNALHLDFWGQVIICATIGYSSILAVLAVAKWCPPRPLTLAAGTAFAAAPWILYDASNSSLSVFGIVASVMEISIWGAMGWCSAVLAYAFTFDKRQTKIEPPR